MSFSVKPAPPPRGWWYQLTPRLILADHKSQAAEQGDTRVLELSSGGAFPLGHPTTRLCLDLLCRALVDAPVRRLVEIGCGSGVLCVAAAALGVPQVVGVDIAKPAVEATRRNARRHGLAVQVVLGSSACLRGTFDLVVANLPIDVQHAQAPALHRLAGSQGRLLLSGFREPDEPALLQFYQQQGWQLTGHTVKYFQHPELPATMNFNWVAWLLAPPAAAR